MKIDNNTKKYAWKVACCTLLVLCLIWQVPMASAQVAPTFDNYTLHLIDNEGNEVFSSSTLTVTKVQVETTDGDPMLAIYPQYCSPFVKRYLYFDSAAEAQANNGNATTWSTTADIYVGYEVDEDKMPAGQPMAIWANTRIMHEVIRAKQTGNKQGDYHNVYELQFQQYDIADMGNAKNSYEQHSNVSVSNMPFVDGTFAWNIGTDPYNVVIANETNQLTVKSTFNSNPSLRLPTETGETHYCILYWQDKKNNSKGDKPVETSADYCLLYDRTTSTSSTLAYGDNNNHYLACTDNWRSIDQGNGSFTTISKVYLRPLPPLNIVILNADKEEEAVLSGFFNNNATSVPTFTPFFLHRAYTSNQAFYYDAEANEQVSGTIDTDRLISTGTVYMTYDIDGGKWITNNNEADKTANTLYIKPLTDDATEINWYMIRPGGNDNYALTATKGGMPATVNRTNKNRSVITDNVETDESKLAQWTFVGTPYSLRLVNRYYGMLGNLGFPENSVAGVQTAVHATSGSDIITSWELVNGLSETDKLFLRPVGTYASNSQLFLGWDGGNGRVGMTVTAGGNQATDVTWVTASPAQSVVFHMYDKDGQNMNLSESVIGVNEGDNLNQVFQNTTLPRRYCQYTYYTDEALTEEAPATIGSDNATIYVKWEYTADAPVFNTGNDWEHYQYYTIASGTGKMYLAKESDGNYLLSTNDGMGSEAVTGNSHQLALVGNPYGFQLFSRVAQKSLGYDDSNSLSFTDTPQLFYMPANDEVGPHQFSACRMDNHHYLNQTWTTASTSVLSLKQIIVSVTVFKEGATASGQEVDHQEYALDYPTEGTDARIKPGDLTQAKSKGTTKDYLHAFCLYDYYYSYDASEGTLSNLIPSSGLFEGIPYMGSDEQYPRAFYATYTVDEEAFGTIYLLRNGGSGFTAFYGMDNAEDGMDGTYRMKLTTTEETAKLDDTKAYHWQLTGDPYDLQLTCLGTGEFYQTMPLGATNTATNNTASVEDGTLLLLTNDETYAQYSHFEVVLNSDGNDIFYLREDGVDRYTYLPYPPQYTQANLILWNPTNPNGHLLIPAVDQHDIVWQVVDPTGTPVDGEQYVRKNVNEGNVVTTDDMPDALKRHFCDYTYYYTVHDGSETFATTLPQLGEDGLAVDQSYTIYVQYALQAGSPTFYSDVSEVTSVSDTYNIRYSGTHYLYDTATDSSSEATLSYKNDKSSTEVGTYGQWVLIGSPYAVQFYNPATGHYISVAGTILPGNPLNTTTSASTNATWILLNDKSGNMATLCLKEDDGQHILYVGSTGAIDIQANSDKAMGAEFVGNKGVDGLTLVLHYGDACLRPGMNATKTETITLNTFEGQGKELDNVLPEWWKRAYCDYTYEYDGATVSTITPAMVSAGKTGTVSIDVYYTVNSDFLWSVQKENDSDSEYHWYYVVNHHKPGVSLGGMLYKNGERNLLCSADLVEDRFYTNNYEWCVTGDPYGFKMLGHYDPEQQHNEYLSVNGTSSNLETYADSGTDLFEMSMSAWSGYFWMHPVYTAEQRAEMTSEPETVSQVGVAINHPVLYTDSYYSNARKSTTGNVYLAELTHSTLTDYVIYAGFVGALNPEAIEDDPGEEQADGTMISLSAIREKIENGETLSPAEYVYLHKKVDDTDNLVPMRQGYYRIISYVYEKGKLPSVGVQRKYFRGYLYGQGTGDLREYDGDHVTNTYSLVINEPLADAEYDPASVFHFAATEDTDGHTRYYVSTQGMNLDGGAMVQAETGHACRYENIGGVLMQLRTAERDNGMNYLSYVQGFNKETEDGIRHCSQHNTFEMYGFTRLYLQPVGSDEVANELPLKLRLNKPTVADGYAYSTLYVPYDVLMDEGAIAFYAKEEHANDGDYRLACHSLESLTGKNAAYVPAGTPVLVRATDDMDEITLLLPANAPDTEGSEAVAAVNLLKGQYLACSITSTSNVYVFGYSTKFEEVGFFIDNDHDANRTKWMLKHNKCYYISGESGSANQYLLSFDDSTDGIREVAAKNTSSNDDVYDLTGRKVSSQALPAGIYVRNGRKFIVK